jgi:hypothetical protein
VPIFTSSASTRIGKFQNGEFGFFPPSFPAFHHNTGLLREFEKTNPSSIYEQLAFRCFSIFRRILVCSALSFPTSTSSSVALARGQSLLMSFRKLKLKITMTMPDATPRTKFLPLTGPIEIACREDIPPRIPLISCAGPRCRYKPSEC